MSQRAKMKEDLDKSKDEISNLLESKLKEFGSLKNRLNYNPEADKIPGELEKCKFEIEIFKSHLISYDGLKKEFAPTISEATSEEMRKKEKRIERNKENHMLKYFNHSLSFFGRDSHKNPKFTPLETFANSETPYAQ